MLTTSTLRRLEEYVQHLAISAHCDEDAFVGPDESPSGKDEALFEAAHQMMVCFSHVGASAGLRRRAAIWPFLRTRCQSRGTTSSQYPVSKHSEGVDRQQRRTDRKGFEE
jgi:hypothetical protein